MSKQVRGIERLRALMSDAGFERDVASIRRLDEFQRIVTVHKLIAKYNILSRHSDIISNYIETGVFTESLLREPARIVVSAKGVVSIELNHDVSQKELMEFISLHWKEMKTYFSGSESALRQEVPLTKRHREIYESYLNKKKLGLTNVGIALRHSVSTAYVGRVISNYRIANNSQKAIKKRRP